MKLLISRRWSIFAITCLSFVLSQFYRSSVAVISPNLISDLGLNTNGLSLISAAFFYGFAITQIPVALYLDSIGPRITMTFLTLIAVGGSLVFALGESLSVLVIGRVLLGIGMACNLMGTLKLITLWFGPSRFATLTAMVVSIGTLGNITAATPLVFMVNTMGWRMTFLVFAGIYLVIAILFFFIIKDRPAIPVFDDISQVTASLQETLASIRHLITQKDYWIISYGTFTRYGIFAAVQALWAGPYLMNALGISPVATGNLLFLMSIGLVLGSPLFGYLSDTWLYSRKIPICFGLVGMMVILVVLAYLQPGADLALLSLLFFSFGLFTSAGQIMYAQIKELMPIERAGTAMTGINFFTMVGVAFFLQALGALMQYLYPQASLASPAFKYAFNFCALSLVVATVLYLFTTETLKKDSKF